VKTLSITVEEDVLQAAEHAAAIAHTDLNALLADYLRRLASGSALWPDAVETSSRRRLLDLLKECRIALDGRPTRESCYTDHRFH
jgi:hypothetical protein